jgi:error-prone DNA polymerase
VRGPSCPLPEMSPHDEMLADFATTGLTTGPHPMAFVRARLEAEQVLPATARAGARDGSRVRVAGVTIVRQRPGTAKGFVFITLEDETGFANAIVTPDMFETHRRAILNLGSMIIEGTVQSRDGVVLIKADRFLPLPGRPHDITISHDFH